MRRDLLRLLAKSKAERDLRQAYARAKYKGRDGHTPRIKTLTLRHVLLLVRLQPKTRINVTDLVNRHPLVRHRQEAHAYPPVR